MMPFILAALGSAFLHPWSGIISKKAAHPITVNCWAMVLLTLLLGPLLWIRDLWPLVIEHWPLILLSNGLKVVYGVSAMYLMGRHAFQVLYPLTRLAPILIFAGEIVLLGADFSWTVFMGVMAIVGGTLVFGLDHHIAHIRARILWAIAGITLCIVCFELADKKLLEFFTPTDLLALTALQLPLNLFPLWIWKKEAQADFRQKWYFVLLALTMGGSFYLSRFAMQGLDASVVSSLRNLSILFGVFLGAHLFDEGHTWLRYTAAVLIIFGAGLVLL